MARNRPRPPCLPGPRASPSPAEMRERARDDSPMTSTSEAEPKTNPPSTGPPRSDRAQTPDKPARPRKPRDKAKVEAGVLLVERWIVAALRKRTFFSLGELNQAIAELRVRLNERPFRQREGSRRTLFESLDRPALKPLPAERYQYGEWKRARVNIDYHVQVDWHFYSVPSQLVRHEVDVRLAASTVQVFQQGKRVALHPRSAVRGAFTTDPAHQPKAHQRHGGTTPGQLVQRARALGPAVAQVAATIIETRPHPEQRKNSE